MRRPGASGRGGVGQHAVSLKPLLGTSAASGFYYRMAPPVGAAVHNGAYTPLSGPIRWHS
jgi:hypothetical protein